MLDTDQLLELCNELISLGVPKDKAPELVLILLKSAKYSNENLEKK